MENNSDLEHNPFADSGLANVLSASSIDPLQSNDDLVSAAMQAHSLLSPTSASKAQEGKERTSSMITSHTPVDVDLPVSVNEDLQISVHDPQTIGDKLKQHTIYSITTKTSSSLFRSPSMTVQRRFKEFLWLFQQLSDHNPGVIVPPVPEKHAIGRFDENFVENRRAQLERMMYKISVHPILSKDPFLIMFLEADVLQTESSSDKKSGGAAGSGGAFKSFFGDLNVPKMQETDDYLEQKRQYIDGFDVQLKNVARVVDSIMKQRESLAGACAEFGESIQSLSQAEINKASEKNLVAFAEVQKQLRDLYLKQGDYDLYYLANGVDEYIRLVASARNAFGARIKAYQTWQVTEQNLIKLRISLEKARLAGAKVKQEKLSQIESEILECESKVVTTKKEFEDVTKLLKGELEAFDVAKVNDMQASLKGFLKSVVVIQKQIVNTWEEYLKNLEPVTSTIAH